MRRRLKTILVLLLGSLGIWLLAVSIAIWTVGQTDHATKSDCIIVLGAAAQGSQPSPVFEQRLRHGIDLYQRQLAPRLLFTGGYGDGKTHSEASVGSAYVQQHGVPAISILLEEKSRTTRQNLEEALKVMNAHGLQSAIIVSDPLHMKRALMMAEDLGIQASSSPTPTSMYRSFGAQAKVLMREVYFMHHYMVSGE
ncbi:YdcF family protein [Roseimicrobium sp. ORNL1]|uniref:YdcF family protein n=1 Tax=Roseimicrobium sp. ORNL1 TaxID=2711231 RepID=UPI0013E1B8FD|nr:YdcF family protein [Roseimicrobium sp. ORNL1]QIF05508.1 YdcF family protein [Roseimicrobium sp. ORNL1]